MTLRKKLLIFIPIGILLSYVAVQAIRVWWYHGYAVGTRTGVLRKLAVKGPPYCKYFSGELVLTGTTPTQQPEIWEFSLDDESDSNPLVSQLREAEKSNTKVTLQFRQDLHSLYRCSPSEYFVTGVQR